MSPAFHAEAREQTFYSGAAIAAGLSAWAAGTHAMEETKRGERTKNGRRASPELRVVGIDYKPAPDAKERLRRLVTILLNHASRTAPPPRDGDAAEGQRGE